MLLDMIQLINISKSYGSKKALNQINLTFEEGKVYGIVGENGAGKTTLFRCIAGLETYEGQVISDIKPLKSHLGLLLTDLYFFPKITGREYIQLLCNAREKSVDINSKNIFDLPLDQYATNYSTGMKKKLAITAILLQENKYFILDEPFNGVDIQSNIIITAIIHQLKSLHKVILISSHIFSTLKDTCDEIHLMEKGILIRSVDKNSFDALESDMKTITLGDKIDQLGLK